MTERCPVIICLKRTTYNGENTLKPRKKLPYFNTKITRRCKDFTACALEGIDRTLLNFEITRIDGVCLENNEMITDSESL